MFRFDDEVAGDPTSTRGTTPVRTPRGGMLRTLFAAALLTTSALAVSPAATTSATDASPALDDTPWQLPATPPRCTYEQANSGDVGDCLMVFYADPSTTGWGAPPAPGVGPGWNWLGYTYRGSPALAEWEATYIRANVEPVAGHGVGDLETHVFAQPLFEGFLDEISANGYRVRSVSGYSFRCTSGNGGWSCPSGDPDDLSNHAWGLAIDMNAGTNPIRSYSSVDGQTACLTPMQTDMPKWVIETAERWGLYWGGYGWNSGCQSTSTQRDRVYRDPPHFEFRGTPEMARAIHDFNLRNDPRRRCWDVVEADGSDGERCNLTGRPEAGWRLPVEVDGPEDAVAAVINLASVLPARAGYLTIESCGPVDGERTTAALTFAAGETASAMAIAPIEDGRFCVYRSADVHSVVDVVGIMTGEPSPAEPTDEIVDETVVDPDDPTVDPPVDTRLWFDPSDPTRLTDTRRSGVCDGEECRRGRVADRGIHVVPTTDDAPRLVSLAVVDGQGPGHAAAGRCDTVGAAVFANINYEPGVARANVALLDNGDDGSCVWAFRETHVVVDELGRLLPDEGLGWRIGQSRRLLDTRRCSDNWCDGTPVGGQAFEVTLDVDSPAAAVMIAVDRASAPGHAWIGSCDDLVDGAPPISNVNYVPGKATANLAIVPSGDGPTCVYVHSDAHVIVDLQAELVEEREIGMQPVDPHRLHDSRDAAGD